MLVLRATSLGLSIGYQHDEAKHKIMAIIWALDMVTAPISANNYNQRISKKYSLNISPRYNLENDGLELALNITF